MKYKKYIKIIITIIFTLFALPLIALNLNKLAEHKKWDMLLVEWLGDTPAFLTAATQC